MGGTVVTGLVFDLPDEPWTKEVVRMRERFDHDRVRFPVEITVVGSSRLGWFSPSQPVTRLIEEVAAVIRDIAPFMCEFSGVEHFAGSNVYYLAMRDETPFHSFQRLLAGSELRFEPTPFIYKPHCTIAALSTSASRADHAALAHFNAPRGHIAISSVSLYAVDHAHKKCQHLERMRLGA